MQLKIKYKILFLLNYPATQHSSSTILLIWKRLQQDLRAKFSNFLRQANFMASFVFQKRPYSRRQNFYVSVYFYNLLYNILKKIFSHQTRICRVWIMKIIKVIDTKIWIEKLIHLRFSINNTKFSGCNINEFIRGHGKLVIGALATAFGSENERWFG